MAKLKNPPLWNPNGSDRLEDRRMWKGNPTNLLQLNSIKYNWAAMIAKKMKQDFWEPDKIDLSQDIIDWRSLLEPEQRAFKGILSYLTFLDSIQGNNVTIIKRPFTAPEAHEALGFQIQQEAIHVESYQCIMQTLFPPEEIDEIYDFWRTDDILRARNSYIASQYQRFADTEEEEDYFLALVADYILEGLYFYNGFQFFFNLAYKQKMGQTSSIFALINRDEASHVFLYQNLINEAITENYFPYNLSDIYDLFEEATKQEIAWTNHICGNDIMGITEDTTRDYTHHLANLRLRAIGLQPMFPDYPNPYRHLASLANVGSNSSKKDNFFETTVTSYNLASAFSGWDEM